MAVRVLVADDNAEMREVLRLILEREGYEVDEAPNGEMALQLFREKPADVVVTDILMPEKDGIQTIMELWRDYPHVKVIAISGSGGPETETNLQYARLFGAMKTFPKPVSRNELIGAIEELLACGALTAHPTFFECVTAMAFDHFARARLDFAVYEVGMGGRLDSTNIVTPEVCVITQIDLDHENYLGHSIQQIAAEKAGILKPGVPVVCAAGRPEARAVIARRAAELNAPLLDLDQGSGIAGRWPAGETLPTPALPGRFQKRNAVTAAMAARELRQRGFPISAEAIASGIAQTRWPGRLELVARAPDVYLDGTHNPAGARELLVFWDERFAGRRIFLIFGAVRDKAVEEITGLLFPRAAHVICTQPRSARAISAQRLAELTSHDADHTEVIAEPEAALARALTLAQPEDVVFATGSLYLVGDLRRWWRARRSPSTITA